MYQLITRVLRPIVSLGLTGGPIVIYAKLLVRVGSADQVLQRQGRGER